jgi:hypothetical protein
MLAKGEVGDRVKFGESEGMEPFVQAPQPIPSQAFRLSLEEGVET